MDIDHSTLAQIAFERAQEPKLTRAQEMSQIADASRRKSAATYRYSLLMYLREVIEQKASEGKNNLEIYSKTLPWTVAELEMVVKFLENDGFTVKLEVEYEKTYIGGGLVTGGLLDCGNYESKATNNRILKISW